MSICPDRGIAGQVDRFFATFKSGRGTKKKRLNPLLWKTVVIRRRCRDRAMDATDLIRTRW
jgi:hypothetical protein